MIKAKTANKIHSILDPNPVKNRYPWEHRAHVRRNEIKNKLTNEQKLAMFDAIVDAEYAGSLELTRYQYERREKKRVQKRRDAAIAAGTRKVKVKTTKAEWLASQTHEQLKAA